MKKTYLISLLLLLSTIQVKAQHLYEILWESDGIAYLAVLAITEDDAFFRVNYFINGEENIVSFKADVIHRENHINYFDGFDVKSIKGSSNDNYYADNFYVVSDKSSAYKKYSEPINNIYRYDDENPIIEEDIDIIWKGKKIKYWNKVDQSDITPEYLQQFFKIDEKEYQYFLKNYTPKKDTDLPTPKNIAVLATPLSVYIKSNIYKTQKTFPKQWIVEQLKKKFEVTQVSYIDNNWLVVMSYGDYGLYSKQEWHISTTFPEQWIESMWKKNYRITEVNYVNNKWVLIMTKGENFGKKQAWNKDEKFPIDWVNNKYEQNLKVTNVTYGEGEWLVIMTDKAVGFDEELYEFEYYPKEPMSIQYDKYKMTVRTIAYGDNSWIYVLVKKLSVYKQNNQLCKNLDEVKQFIDNNSTKSITDIVIEY